MDTLKALTLFFKYSAKHKHILHEHLKSSAQEDFLADCVEGHLVPAKRRYEELPVPSDTRWLTRVDTIDCLLKNYRAVCEAVEAVWNSSSGQSANDVDSYLKRLLSFELCSRCYLPPCSGMHKASHSCSSGKGVRSLQSP